MTIDYPCLVHPTIRIFFQLVFGLMGPPRLPPGSVGEGFRIGTGRTLVEE